MSAAPTPPVDTDNGAPQERTDLAWSRTAAGMLVAAALHVRIGAMAGGEAAFLPGFLFAAIGLITLLLAERGSIGRRTTGPSATLPHYAITIATVMFGLVSMGLAVSATR